MISNIRSKIYQTADSSKTVEYFTRLNHTELKDRQIKNLRVQVIHASNLNKKPQKNYEQEDPFLPPFEDGLFVQDFEAHRLLLNKFSLIKYHVLLVTKMFEDQSTKIKPKDFEEAFKVMKSLKGLCYYNSGEHSGHSQPHRHIQIVPRSRELYTKVVDQIDSQLDKTDGLNGSEFKFFVPDFFSKYKCHVISLPEYAVEAAGDSLEHYSRKVANRYNELLLLLENKDLKHSYNLIWTERWMLMVLRSKDRAFDQYSANSLAVMGSFLCKSEESMKQLATYPPSQIYDEILQINS
jgi:ATP adenylyltransferase